MVKLTRLDIHRFKNERESASANVINYYINKMKSVKCQDFPLIARSLFSMNIK